MRIILYYNFTTIQALVCKKVKGKVRLSLLEKSPDDISVKGVSEWLKGNFTAKELKGAEITLVSQEGISNVKTYTKDEFSEINFKELTTEYKHLTDKKKIGGKSSPGVVVIFKSDTLVKNLVSEFRDNGIEITNVVSDVLSLINATRITGLSVSNPFATNPKKEATISLLPTGSKVLAITHKEGISEMEKITDTKVSIYPNTPEALENFGRVFTEVEEQEREKERLRREQKGLDLIKYGEPATISDSSPNNTEEQTRDSDEITIDETDFEYALQVGGSIDSPMISTDEVVDERTDEGADEGDIIILDDDNESEELSINSTSIGAKSNSSEEEYEDNIYEVEEIVLNITEGKEIKSTMTEEEVESTKEQLIKIQAQIVNHLKILISASDNDTYSYKVNPGSLGVLLGGMDTAREGIRMETPILEESLKLNGKKFLLENSVIENPPMVLIGALVSL